MINRTVVPVVLASACVAAVLGFSLSAQPDKRDALAASGQIQEDAPVKAVSELAIDAPLEKVWRLLTAMQDWPTWQPSISAAHMDGPLRPGTTFT